MKRYLPLAFALAVGSTLGATAKAQITTSVDAALIPVLAANPPAPQFAENTPVVVVGRITSEPKRAIHENKMQVRVGSEGEFTLHFRGADMYGLDGRKIGENDLDDGQWVRAEGRMMNDPRRVRVDRLQIIAPDEPGYYRTAFFRPGLRGGYISAVAGSRQTYYPDTTEVWRDVPIVLVGRVSDDTGPFEATRRIQVMSGGNEWTLNVPHDAVVRDRSGKEISVHEIHKNQWIRAEGFQTGDLRMRVDRVENIGRNEAFRTSTYYRTASPLGYFERTDLATPTMYRGRVTAIDRDHGWIELRDDDGFLRRVYLDQALIDFEGRRVILDNVHNGDMITITGRLYP
jgi:hypothetical protein